MNGGIIMKASRVLNLKLKGVVWCIKHPIITYVATRKGAYSKYPHELLDKWFDNPSSYVERYTWCHIIKCLVLGKEV